MSVGATHGCSCCVVGSNGKWIDQWVAALRTVVYDRISKVGRSTGLAFVGLRNLQGKAFAATYSLEQFLGRGNIGTASNAVLSTKTHVVVD